ncbi:hypothetical protein B1201_15970 [Acinetobacter sp. ANC 5600]|nr:hypothetical protein B1201_15970 [Acinetobacter sp. ANC 5600]
MIYDLKLFAEKDSKKSFSDYLVYQSKIYYKVNIDRTNSLLNDLIRYKIVKYVTFLFKFFVIIAKYLNMNKILL